MAILPLIEPLSSLLTDKRSIIPHPLISLVEDDALTEGEIAKVIYPLSSILKTLAPKVRPAIPYSKAVSPSAVQLIGS